MDYTGVNVKGVCVFQALIDPTSVCVCVCQTLSHCYKYLAGENFAVSE